MSKIPFENQPIVLLIKPTEIQDGFAGAQTSQIHAQFLGIFFQLSTENLEQILQNIIGEGLRADPVEHPILIIELLYPTEIIRVEMNQRIASFLFKSLGVPALFFIPSLKSNQQEPDPWSRAQQECTQFRVEDWVLRNELDEYEGLRYENHSTAARMEVLRIKLVKMGLLNAQW